MGKIIDDRWIGIEEAANYLGVNKDTIRNWIKKIQESQLIRFDEFYEKRKVILTSKLRALFG